MSRFLRTSVCTGLLAAGCAMAGEGLIVPDETELWPRFQARLSVTTVRPGLSLLGPRALPSVSLLGDYYPALPWLAPGNGWRGGLRATGGLLPARPGLHVPGLGGAATGWHARVDETLTGGADVDGAEGALWPYVGVGYTGLSRRSGWGFVADVGLVAHVPGHVLGLGRHASGGQGLDDALREIRLSPMVQVGVRYAF